MKRFGLFWWDFIVGDDWRLAIGVVIGIGATVLLSHLTGLDPWWLLPPLVALLLMRSLQRASREGA
jgi:hypothetical protein